MTATQCNICIIHRIYNICKTINSLFISSNLSLSMVQLASYSLLEYWRSENEALRHYSLWEYTLRWDLPIKHQSWKGPVTGQSFLPAHSTENWNSLWNICLENSPKFHKEKTQTLWFDSDCPQTQVNKHKKYSHGKVVNADSIQGSTSTLLWNIFFFYVVWVMISSGWATN